jgi:alpha-glucosidase
VIYEIYPRSFGDSNGNGISDLNGITEHLGYLQKLGVDAIWIAPMYPSSQVDFGKRLLGYLCGGDSCEETGAENEGRF